MTKTNKQAERQKTWQAHIDAWRCSGLTQQAYCDKQGIRPNQLWYWKRRLAPKADTTPNNSVKQPSAFIPLHVEHPPQATQGLSVALPNGIVIQGVTESTLKSLKPLLGELS